MPITAEADIANLALSHLGVGHEITSLTERSEEARACLRFYATARDDTLRAFPWGFASVIGALTLVATGPNSEWGYSYRMPPEAVALRRILSGMGRLGGASVFTQDWLARGVSLPTTPDIPFRLSRDASGVLIFTDLADSTNGIFAEYTYRETDVTRFPPDFVLALSYKLASLIAARVTMGDPTKLGERNEQKYLYTLAIARADSANERQQDPPPDSEFVRARG